MPAAVAAPGADGSAVAAVTVTANPAAFPAIELLVSAKNAAGQPVATLAASSMRVAEDGIEHGFVLVENAVPRPRVLVIYDTSLSVPQAFFEDAGKTTFGQSLAQALEDRVATVQLLALGTSADTPSPDKWSTPLPAAFGEAVRVLPTPSSLVWTALRNAAAAAPTVIVLVSDFQTDEKNDPNLVGSRLAPRSARPSSRWRWGRRTCRCKPRSPRSPAA